MLPPFEVLWPICEETKMKFALSIAMCIVSLFFPLTSSAESCWGQGKLTTPFAN